MSKVFKVCYEKEWESVKNNAFFEGSEIDQSDGFIHFSTSKQLKGTLEKYFARKNHLYLLEVNTDELELVWELSRNNQLFPHLYKPLPLSAIKKIHRIFMDINGNHIIPEDVYND
mgnify:CR=1 FL=1